MINMHEVKFFEKEFSCLNCQAKTIMTCNTFTENHSFVCERCIVFKGIKEPKVKFGEAPPVHFKGDFMTNILKQENRNK